MITSERTIAAPAHLVHALLADVEAWSLWSPHISRVEPSTGSVATGWTGRVKAWFAPAATTMTRPLSAFGQRRRLARLGALAEFEARRGPAGR